MRPNGVQQYEIAVIVPFQCLVEGRQHVGIQPFVEYIERFAAVHIYQTVAFFHEIDKRTDRFLIGNPCGSITRLLHQTHKRPFAIGTVGVLRVGTREDIRYGKMGHTILSGNMG